MSASGTGSSVLTGLSFLEELRDAYNRHPTPTARYVLLVVIPAALVFLTSSLVALLLPLPMIVRGPIPLLGGLAVLSAVLYPKLQMDARRAEIDSRFHLIMTHMTVLATTRIDRMEVFRKLAAESEYGAGADEMYRLVQLVDTWNLSLDDACRRRARRVPSDALEDFYDRLGYTLAAGQSLEDFLLAEHEFILERYVTIYESTLTNLEVMKDLYLSIILSMTFALVFAIVLPILIGSDPAIVVSTLIVVFIFVQLGFYVSIHGMSPSDPVWFHPNRMTHRDRRMQMIFYGSWGITGAAVLIVGLGVVGIGPGIEGVLFFLDSVPLALYIAVPISPLIIIGFQFRRAEKDIVDRDRAFPSFIRALGAAESAKQSPTSTVLKSLREKDFGPLTPAIERLYRRLSLGIDTGRSWAAFAADTRSYLIQKFSEMYTTGRQMGGEPKQLGELISSNMNAVNQLREQRRQSTITLIGVLYGITAAAVFSLFVGVEIVIIITEMSRNLQVQEFQMGMVISADVYDVPVIESLLLVVVMGNALLSSVMIRTIDGGHMANAYLHFVLLTWLGCLTAIGTAWLVGGFLVI